MTTSMLLGSRRLTRIWRFWRTPKGLMLLILAGLIAAAVPLTGGHPVRLVLAGAAAACALEVLIAFALRAEWEFPSGALLTGMFVAGVLSPFERLDVIVVTALLAILVGFHVWSELLGQWSRQSLDPLRIGRLPRPAVKSVLHRREKERYRIDQSSVQIEKNGVWPRFKHTAKVMVGAATS